VTRENDDFLFLHSVSFDRPPGKLAKHPLMYGFNTGFWGVKGSISRKSKGVFLVTLYLEFAEKTNYIT